MLNILIYLLTSISSVCLFGAAMLMLNARGIRARYFLAVIVLYLGGAFAMATYSVYTGYISNQGLFSSNLIFSGAVSALIIMIYPIEVIFRGWLNIKRYIMLSLPLVIVAAVYVVDRYVIGHDEVCIKTAECYYSNILTTNVLMRTLGMVVTIFYCLYPILIVEKNIKSYNRHVEENFSDAVHHNVLWLRLLLWFLLAIVLLRFVWIISGSLYVSVAYTAALFAISVVTIYRGLFQENIYRMETISRRIIPISVAERVTKEEDEVLSGGDEDDDNNVSLREYAQKIRQWVEEEKPYLRQDLQLMDLSEVVPINRTYMSKIFNDYFGCSFSQYIRTKRVEYVKEMLHKYPSATLNDIAVQSGFYSASTMHKAFSATMGVTVTQYRTECNSLMGKSE